VKNYEKINKYNSAIKIYGNLGRKPKIKSKNI